MVKKVVFPIFVLYLCVVLGLTVFNRSILENVSYNFDLFWSYKEVWDASDGDVTAFGKVGLFWEIVLNYLLLLPYGIMLSLWLKKWVVLLSGALLSVVVELTQFLFRRGLFEFDDIIGNTFGILIGIGIFGLIEEMVAGKRKVRHGS